VTSVEPEHRDPAFVERFARAYEGSAAPVDALWWQEHPDETGPSGAPSPALALAELRRAMYAPGADPEASERYQRARAEQEREDRAARAALRAAAGGAAGSIGAERRQDGPAEPDDPAAAGRAPEPGAGVRRSRTALLASLAAVVAFAGGVLVAPALGRIGTSGAAPSPTSSVVGPFISGSSGSGSALGIFGEPQRDIDRPAIGPDARLLPGSFRRLAARPERGVTVYAAEDAAGDVCLVALSAAGGIDAACTSIASFRSTPLRLAFRADGDRAGAPKTARPVQLVATWRFLGPFDLEEMPLTAGE
jgi:hypothetical protein